MNAAVKTIPALLAWRAAKSPGAVAYCSRDEGGDWVETTWSQHFAVVQRVARGLRAAGLHSGDRVAICAPSSERWEQAHHAALLAGATVVGLDAHDTPARRSAAARRASVNAIIASGPADLDALDEDVRQELRLVVLMEGTAPGATSWSEIVCQEVWGVIDMSARSPDQEATLVFTSGTTGEPRPIVYRHEQLLTAISSMLEAFPRLGVGGRTICWLPLSNLFQRVANLVAMAQGARTFFVEDPRHLAAALPEIRPHVLIGVPRFFEKLYQEITTEIARRPMWQRLLINAALKIGAARTRRVATEGRRPGRLLRAAHWLAERLVLRRLRAFCGGALRCFISGSAPMPRWLLEALHAMGLLVLEAYGVSECAIPIAANRLESYRFSTVGRPLKGNLVSIAPDGELWVKGPGVCADPSWEGPERWHATGDYAGIEADGFVRILGRKAEVFKLTTGRRVAPAPIEAALRGVPYVDHALVWGEGCKRPLALILLDERAPKIGGRPNPRRIAADLDRVLAEVPGSERPAACLLSTAQLTIDDGALTANAKLRRHVVVERFAHELRSLRGRVNEAHSTRLITQLAG